MNRPVPNYAGFLEYWLSLRAPDELVVPSQSFLDNPNPIFATNVLVLDVYEDDIVIRLQATGIVERWGADLTGESMFKAPLPMNRPEMMNNVYRLISHPCGLRSVNKTRTSGGRAIAVETFGLPLAVDENKPSRMINYAWIMDSMGEGEHSEEVSEYEVQAWIDIGAGTPSGKPLKPMTTR